MLKAMQAEETAWRLAFRRAFLETMRDHLTERQYQALCLHELEGKQQKQIAALWGVSPSAVCRQIRRARKRMAAVLWGDG